MSTSFPSMKFSYSPLQISIKNLDVLICSSWLLIEKPSLTRFLLQNFANHLIEHVLYPECVFKSEVQGTCGISLTTFVLSVFQWLGH